jgi:hypothetical protein
MRNKFTLTILCLAMSFLSVSAKVWTVNNKETNNADFDKIQSAINSNAVAEGDTLYIEGSPLRYDNFATNKRIVIIGPGYLLNQNQNSANVDQVFIDVAEFKAGSEGSVIMGVTFITYSGSGIVVGADNVLIERCYIRGEIVLHGGVRGTIIKNNYVGSIDEAYSGDTFSNITVLNNIIVYNIENNSGSAFAVFDNNILLGNYIKLTTQNFRNNIITDGKQTFNIVCTNKTNNIAANSLFFNDPKNYDIKNTSDLFVGGDSPDGKYLLSANSYAKGKGHDGKDCGIFGGENPYVLSGLPTTPVITVLDTDGIGTKEEGLKIKLGVKSF